MPDEERTRHAGLHHLGCGTLQRAIRSGRLALTPDHHLTPEALALAGYMPVAVSQGHAVGTPQANAADMPQGQMSQFTPQVLERMDRLEAGMREVVDRLERLERRMAPHLDAACTPQIYSSSWEI